MTIDRDNEAERNARIEEMLRRLERVQRRVERMATQGQHEVRTVAVAPPLAADDEQPAIAVWTDPTGYILDATPGAARLLGMSRRALVHRLMHMFVRANRAHVLRILDVVGRGHAETLDVELQPKERRKVAVRVQLQLDRQDGLGPVVRWVIHPITEGSTGKPN